MPEPTPQLIQDLQRLALRLGRSPTPADVRAAANFREPGGIGRLCEAIAWTLQKRNAA